MDVFFLGISFYDTVHRINCHTVKLFATQTKNIFKTIFIKLTLCVKVVTKSDGKIAAKLS